MALLACAPTLLDSLSSPIVASRLRLTARSSPSPVAQHDHGGILLYTQGQARFELRERLEVQAGDVVIVPAGAPHRMLAARDVEAWGLGVQPSCLAAWSDLAPLDPFDRVRRGSLAAVRLPAGRQSFVESLLRELAAPALDERASRALFTLILHEIAQAHGAGEAGTAQDMEHPDTTASVAGDGLVADALAYIERHCTEAISLRDVAAAVRRSPAYVTTRLRQVTGHSVGAWITASRMAEARRRLLHADESIEVVGERVGYADATHFIRVFRKAHGQTPAAWRRQRREVRPVIRS